jgi:hypothetical protein
MMITVAVVSFLAGAAAMYLLMVGLWKMIWS